MEFRTDYRTERYILHTKWNDLPQKVQNRAVMCGVDLMTALIIGSEGKQFHTGRKMAKALGLSGTIPVVGSSDQFNLLGAAIAMGHSSNSFDIDDGHRIICGHPGTSFVGGVLAAALHQNTSWREYLISLVVCYELTIRWAMAMQAHYGYLHSTGAYGAFGTAAGVGRLLGLHEQQLNCALSIADFHAPMTPVMRAVEYPSMNKDGVPFGALVGTMAVLETLYGETGKTHLLEMPEYGAYLDDLGEKYHIMDLYFKPYTCCRWAHQPIRACLDLTHEYNIDPDDIAHVKVHTFRAAARLSKEIPGDTDEAQYNIAYPVASAIIHGDLGYSQICDDALNDKRVLNMMQKLEFVVDPEMEKEFPVRRLAWVEISMSDDQIYTSKVYDAPGEPEDPTLSLPWVADKFRRITKEVLSSDQQEMLLDLMAVQLDLPVRTVVQKVNSALMAEKRV